MVFKRVLHKFRLILSKHQKVRILELAVLMVIGGFMEMLSVSLILQFMNAVMSPEVVMSNQYVKIICNLFGIQINRTFLVFLALIMAVIYILKNVFLLFQMNVQNRFVYNNMFFIQQRLLHNYLMRPYDFFLSAKSGEILRVIGSDTSGAFHLLTTLLQMFSELVVSAALIGTIFFIAPGVTIGIAALLFAIELFILGIIRPVLARAGIKNRDAYTKMNQWLLQSIQGIKEVKIMQREPFFEENFSTNGHEYVKTTYQNQTLGLVPRFMVEAIAMSTFFIVIALMLYKGKELEAIVPMLSAVAMAAIRLLPSVNRISQCMANISFGEPTLDKMIENLGEADKYNRSGAAAGTKGTGSMIRPLAKEIQLSSITYRYPAGKKNVLIDASMKIHKGESIGIVGASGAGKTTAVDLLLGLLRPDGGKVLIDGTDIQLDMKGWLNQIGYIPQTIFMLDGDVQENVAFGIPKDEIDDEKVWKALENAAVAKDVRELPDGVHTQLGERGVRLSGGQRQRIGIARALYSDPDVLFFDEATSALDNETEAAIMDSIHRLHGNKTMVIIAHRLSTIEDCDHIFRVEDGKIVMER